IKEEAGLTGIAHLVDRIARHVDDMPPPETGHRHTRFAGLLPRDVRFDAAKVARGYGIHVPEAIAEEINFTYYPTIILSWTALGLFIGIFLDGFVKGERLRGGEAKAPRA
ncbi:MAG TPA: hypothetical protein VJZ00_17330, partial [Thermoanaerobaculia bacterium]|nr:hypothetical protein [Thermoanaerobaculia bacterium]